MCNLCVLALCLCVFFRDPRPTERRSMAWFRTHNLEDDSEAYVGIAEFKPHSGYQRLSGVYRDDIALVKLKRKIVIPREAQTVELASSTDTFDPSSECFILGWGNVGPGGTSNNR